MNAVSTLKLPENVRGNLHCPYCSGELELADHNLQCSNPLCSVTFPIIDGMPILINDQNSLFSTETIIRQYKVAKLMKKRPQTRLGHIDRFRNWLLNNTPDVGLNVNAEGNYRKFAEHLLKLSDKPAVLVIGGSVPGHGMEILYNIPHITLVETDVVFGPRTMIFFDAHDIPFKEKTFDGVIIQAVLEHVVDPFRCVFEIHRVLKDRGFVYAETAFMQQVHGGRYDFMRFTHTGHRRLFHNFEEIDSGAACGPGMALAWAYKYFLVSFFDSKRMKQFADIFARLTSFFLKSFDKYLVNKPGALDAASAFYFMGEKSGTTLEDNELKSYYRGAQLG